MFLLQEDSKYKRRAYIPWNLAIYKMYKKINQAVAVLKKKDKPYRLCYYDNESKVISTILHYEGAQECFHDNKKIGLMKIGPRMWIVKSLVKKTNIKRSKKKVECAPSNLLTNLEACVKFIPQDSN